MQVPQVAVFGGSGFIGRYVVQELARAGCKVRVVSRYADAGKETRTYGQVGQISLVQANLNDAESIKRAIDGVDAVINLVGILCESGGQSFAALHAQGAERLAKLAAQAGVKRLTHLSALGVDRSLKSKYARTKANGEKAVIAAFPSATILRPSVVFGPEDNFYNKFARMAQVFRMLPLIGGGHSRFQPVYVGDVARAIVKTVLGPQELTGKVYELGGPSRYTFRQILEYILEETDREARLIPVPFGIASLLGALLEILPCPPLTRDQVTLLHYDNVLSGKFAGLEELGITPTAVEAVMPRYLAAYREGGPFALRRYYS